MAGVLFFFENTGSLGGAIGLEVLELVVVIFRMDKRVGGEERTKLPQYIISSEAR